MPFRPLEYLWKVALPRKKKKRGKKWVRYDLILGPWVVILRRRRKHREAWILLAFFPYRDPSFPWHHVCDCTWSVTFFFFTHVRFLPRLFFFFFFLWERDWKRLSINRRERVLCSRFIYLFFRIRDSPTCGRAPIYKPALVILLAFL